jgi:PAS domain S-box-containing protein
MDPKSSHRPRKPRRKLTHSPGPKPERGKAGSQAAPQTPESLEIDYRAIFNSLGDAVLILETDTGRILQANPRMGEMFGYSPDEIRALTIKDLWQDEHCPERVRRGLGAAAQGEPQVFMGAARDSAGIPFWVEVHLLPATLTGPDRVLAVMRDITGRKEMLQAIVQSEARFRTVIESSLAGVYLIQDDRFVYVNPRFAQIFGFRTEEIVGRLLQGDLVHPDDRATVTENIRRRLSGELDSVHYTFRGRRKDGSVINVEVLGRRVEFLGRPAVIGTVMDITLRRQAEEQLRRRDAILQAVAFAGEKLLRFPSEENNLQEILARLGQAAAASRAYIFELLTRPDGTQVVQQRYEWAAPGVTTTINMPEVREFDWREAGYEDFEPILRRGGVVFGPARDFPEKLQERYARQNIQAILLVPVLVGSELWGIIGFDDCFSPRQWSAAEIDALRTASLTLGAALKRQRDEESLQTHRKLLNTIIISTPDLMVLKDCHSVYRAVNPAFCQFLGKAEEEILGKTDLDLFPPIEAEIYRRDDARVMASGVPQAQDEEVTGDAGRKWLHVIKTPILDDRGQAAGVLCSVRDVTQRKRMEAELQRRDAILEAVAAAGEKLLSSASWEDPIQEILGLLGQAVQVSSVRLFEKTADPDGSLSVQERYSWNAPCIAIPPVEASPQKLPWAARGPGSWGEFLAQSDIIYGQEQDFLEKLQEHPALRICGSTLAVPVFLGADFWGVLCFQDCQQKRDWGAAEVVNLRTAANILGTVMQRQAIEKALRTSEANYRTIFNAVNDAIAVVDSKTGDFSEVNQKWCEMAGFTQEEARRLNVAILCMEGSPQYSPAEALGAMTRALQQGPQMFEWLARDKFGREHWVEVNLKPTTIGGQDRLLAVVRDIMGRKQAETALRESEERYRSLINDVLGSSSVGTVILDADFKIVWANRALAHFFGLPREEIIGQDKPRLIQEIKNIFADPETFARQVLGTYEDTTFAKKFECHVLAQGGRPERWLEHWSQPIVTGPYAGGRIEHFSDISARKQVEASLQESEKQLRFLASQLLDAQENERRRISRELHDELGQALTLLKINLVAIEEKIPREQKKLREECEHLLNYTDQIIENVRRLSWDLSPTILEDLGLSSSLHHLLYEICKNQDIIYHKDVDELGQWFSPALQTTIYRIFQESLTNVCRHAQATRVMVNIKRHGRRVTFTLADNGVGFDVNEVLSRNLDQRGLGLTAIQERVFLAGGKLQIWSQKARGTRITFTLPIDRKESQASQQGNHGNNI